MAIDFTKPELTELSPKIIVIGVGGAGGNAINNMISAGLTGVDFIAANTDAQALANSRAETKLQLGLTQTRGLGAGARPEVGSAAAEEVLDQIEELIDGANMVFVTAGMGGGTGTGAAPVIARAAREKGILTVGVVTKPFMFEGQRRMRMAMGGIEELHKNVDTLIIIPNQNLFRLATEKTSFLEAFAMADQVLHSGVRGITDLMLAEGLINLDFADICTVMSEMGKAMMGTGEASGERRAIDAAEAAISNPLLDEVSLKGAKGVIVNVTGGHDMSLMEVHEAINHIAEQVDPDANIIFGAALDDSMEGNFRLTVVATGISGEDGARAPADEQLNLSRHSGRVFTGGVVTPLRAPSAPAASAKEEITVEALSDNADEADVLELNVEAIAEAAETPAVAKAEEQPQPAQTPAPEAAVMETEEPVVATKPVDLREARPFIREPIIPHRQAKPAAQKTASSNHSLLDRMRLGRRVVESGERVEEVEAKPAAMGRIDPSERPAPPVDRDQELKIPPFLYKISN